MTTTVAAPEEIAWTPGRRATKAIRAAIRGNDTTTLQSLMLQHLQKPLRRLQKRRIVASPLSFWSVDDLDLNGRERELASAIENLPAVTRPGQKRHAAKQRELQQRLNALLTAWREDANGDCGSWELLAVAELLFEHGERISSPLFVSTLIALTEYVPAIQQALEHAGGGPRLELLLQAEAGLLVCELAGPLHLSGCRAQPFVKATWEAFHHAVDDKGMWQSTVFTVIPAWMASFVRCQMWCEAFGARWMARDQENRWAKCVRKLISQLTCDGQCLSERLASSVSADRFLNVLSHAARVRGTSLTGRFATLLQECTRVSRSSRPLPTAHSVLLKKGYAKKSQIPAWQSDDTSTAVIRNSTQPFADAVTLAWSGEQVDIALAAAGVAGIRGSWPVRILVDGAEVPRPSSWRASCWYRDSEVALVELSGTGCGELKVIRQIVVSLQQQFAVLTDSVSTESAAQQVTIQSALSLLPGTVATPDEITSELMLSPHKRRHIRALPAWMEDDRLRASNGTFEFPDDQLRMSATGQGGVVLPLLLDWNEKRSNAVADWNRLTVCEEGRNVGDHEAGAYRIRAGKLQLAVYRSLKIPEMPRSVLGIHTGDESVYAQIESGDPPRCLVDIESPQQQDAE